MVVVTGVAPGSGSGVGVGVVGVVGVLPPPVHCDMTTLSMWVVTTLGVEPLGAPPSQSSPLAAT